MRQPLSVIGEDDGSDFEGGLQPLAVLPAESPEAEDPIGILHCYPVNLERADGSTTIATGGVGGSG